ncbi:cupin [Virgibacillus sp. 6R]|uniref:cupin n=1 Tax=Metabacillus sp. 22489 TaxID=3453928 RepID=UPI0011A898F9
MELYTFAKENGKFITNFMMSRIIQTDKTTHIGCMYLEEKGVIGYHQAVVPQLLLVVSGEGYVRAETEEYIKVQSGDAIFWQKDEWHETKTDVGPTAIVIESEALNPSAFMALKK